jgi:hypothetical protein
VTDVIVLKEQEISVVSSVGSQGPPGSQGQSGSPGPAGTPGPTGPGVFFGDTAPAGITEPYLWIQTGLGTAGNSMTFGIAN